MRKLRKWIPAFLVVTSLVLMSGCGRSQQSDAEEAVRAAQEEAEAALKAAAEQAEAVRKEAEKAAQDAMKEAEKALESIPSPSDY